MKKLLLTTLALAGLTLSASAADGTICFNAGTNNYTGTADPVITLDGVQKGTDNFISKTFTAPGVCSIKFADSDNNNAPFVSTNHVRWYQNDIMTIIPEEGVTITEMKFKCTAQSYAKDATASIGTYSLSGLEATWSGSAVEEFTLTPAAQIRFYYVEVTYTGAKEAVKNLVFSPVSSFVEKGTKVTISTETDGAEIYYTVNGDEPSASSTKYTEDGIEISGMVTIKAVGIKDGFVNSSIAESSYGVVLEKQDSKDATFDFTDLSSLSPAQTAPESSSEISVSDVIFTNDKVSISFDKAETTTDPRLYVTKDAWDLRIYNGQTFTIKAEDATLNNIKFDAPNGISVNLPESGAGLVIGDIWSAEEGKEPSSITFNVVGTSRINGITVNYTANTPSGIADIVTDDENAPVEYYNLQGVRVDNPGSGLYIRRQGKAATKILVK